MQFPNPIVTELIISYPTGNPAVQIGPGPEIILYGSSGDTITISANEAGGNPAILFTTPTNNVAEIFGSGVIGGTPALQVIGFFYPATNYGSFEGYPWFYMYQNSINFQFIQTNVPSPQTYGAGMDLFDNLIHFWTGVAGTLSAFGNGIVMGQNNFTSDLPWQTGVWQNVSFGNGWHNAGGDNANFQYRLCSDGFIHWRGVISPGNTADGTIIGAFIASNPYLPPESRFLYRSGADGTTPANNPQVKFDTSGNITCFGMAGVTFLAFDGWLYESNQYMA